VAGYAPLITAYIKVLMTRISFIIKNREIPAILSFEDKPFQVPTDIDYVFQLAVEVFDMQSSLLHLYAAVMTNLDPSRGVTAPQIQCRLAPLIPAIQVTPSSCYTPTSHTFTLCITSPKHRTQLLSMIWFSNS